MLLSLSVLVRVATCLLPVLLFLAGLVVIDSYKLVRFRAIVLSILAGLAAAGAAYLVNRALTGVLPISPSSFARYVAPVVEESCKALYLVVLIRTARVGFTVDAAIHGFAVGAGFACLENLYYLYAAGDPGLLTWIVRGFGTAVMHGGATAIFGMVSRTVADREERARLVHLLPGLGLAVVLHSLFNHFLLPPLLTTAAVVLVFPPCMVLVFQQSEKATRSWLGVGFDTDQELLLLILSGKVAETPAGRYLNALKARFPGEVIVDMLCLLRLHVELSIRAKGILMIQKTGFRMPPDPTIRSKFDELRYLEHAIGTTGLLAMQPFLHTSSRDLWQRNMLADQG